MAAGFFASCKPTAEEIAGAWVRTTIDEMPLSRLVSQLFIVALPENESEFEPESYERLRFWVTRFEAGGVVLLRSSSSIQAAIIADLQDSSRIPILVARDMESWAAMRIKNATEFPSAIAIAATDNPEFAFEAGRITAEKALSLGVNLILVPDANSIPRNSVIRTRSFGDPPRIAGEYIRRFVHGVQRTGALATVKYSPGHGDASRVPDTLSGSLWAPLLSDRLGGLIVSDALNVAGVGNDDPGDVAVRAIDAGVDLLLLSPDPEAASRSIIKAVQEGRLSETRIRQSVERILRAKTAAGLHLRRQTDLNQVRSILSRPEHRSLSATIARRSLVLLANDGLIPLVTPERSILLVSVIESNAIGKEEDLVREVTRRHNGPLLSRVIDTATWRLAIDGIIRDAERHDIVLIADQTSEFRPQPNTIGAILDRISTSRRPIIFVGMGSPYSLPGADGQANAILLSFGSSRVVAGAIAGAIFGESPICGQLPIQLSDTMTRGSGLCLRQTFPRRGYPGDVGMSAMDILNLDSLLIQAVADSVFPGAAIAVGRAGVIVHMDGYGRFTYESGQNVTPESLFDLASLTKVIATTTAMMQFYEAGQISLDDPVSRFITAFAANGKGGVTIRDLLTHTSGLIPFRRFYEIYGANRDTVLTRIMADSLVYEPGSSYRYSDFGPIMLALIAETITGQSFDDYTREHIFEPLGMFDTGFRKVQGRADPHVVPTERDDYFRNRLVQGEVHDENAYLLEGTAGHAGLFSNARDLARFAYMMVHEGRVGNKVFLKPATIRLFTTAVDPEKSHTRALGWDTKSPEGYSSAGRHFGSHSFGHTGFTGTSIWIDPDQALYVILLTNRVYPSRENRGLIAVRPAVADLVFSSIRSEPTSRFFNGTE